MVFRLLHTWLLVVLFSLSAISNVAGQPGVDYWVIGNTVGVEQLSAKQVENVFTGTLTLWKNGNSVTVVMHDSKSDECQKTADLFFKGSVMALQKFWLSIVFQGRSSPPVFLKTHDEIVSYVQQNEGAIAIVYQRDNIEGLEIGFQ